MGDAGHDDLPEIPEDPVHGLPFPGRPGRQLPPDISGKDRRVYGVIFDSSHVFGHPIHEFVPETPKKLGFHGLFLRPAVLFRP